MGKRQPGMDRAESPAIPWARRIVNAGVSPCEKRPAPLMSPIFHDAAASWIAMDMRHNQKQQLKEKALPRRRLVCLAQLESAPFRRRLLESQR